jgi:hypothetical protein
MPRSHRLAALGTLAVCLLVPAASAAAPASAFDRGGAFCFREGAKPLPGGFRTTLKLVVERRPGRGLPLWGVNGLERSVDADQPAYGYVDQLVGTATVAKPNNGLPGGQRIQLNLTGATRGDIGDPTQPGLWWLRYAVQLNLRASSGHITGTKSFTPISGTVLGTPQDAGVDVHLTRIACSAF